MTRILAIDPGTTRSAWCVVSGPNLLSFGIVPNEYLLDKLRARSPEGAFWEVSSATEVVIEKVESFGMAVGAEVFETVYWAGRFAEAASPLPVARIGRKAVKLHLCGSSRAKDPNIRAALIDRFGGPAAIKRGGQLHGVAKDVWAALAVGVTWLDLHREEDAA